MLAKLWKLLNTPPKKDPSSGLFKHVQKPISEYIDGHLIQMIYAGVYELIMFFQRILLVTPTAYLRTSEFWEVYKTMINLSLVFLALILPIFAILKLAGKRFSFEPMMLKLVFMPPAIINGPYILFRLVEVFNRISTVLINTEGMILPKKAEFGTMVGLILFMLIFAYQVFKLIMFYGERMIKIILFATLLPVIYVLWCLPTHSHVISKYTEDILSLLVSQVVHCLVLLILGTIVMGASEITGLYTIVYQVGALSVMNKTEQIIAGYLGSHEKPAIKSFKKGMYKYKSNKRKIKRGVKNGKVVVETAKKAIRRLFSGF